MVTHLSDMPHPGGTAGVQSQQARFSLSTHYVRPYCAWPASRREGTPPGDPYRLSDGSNPMRRADVRDEERTVRREKPRHPYGVREPQHAEQRGDPMRLRVKKLEPHERAAHLLHVRRGMNRHLPFNERWGHPSEGKAAVWRNRYQPVQCSARHGLDLAERLRSRGQGVSNVGGAGDPSGQARPGNSVRVVQCKPARTLRLGGLWVGRDDFQVRGLAQS